MSAELAINLKGVGILRSQRWILQGVDWQLPVGAIGAILGPNGSGKSTLARILAAHLYPTAGQVGVLGSLFGQVNLQQLRQNIRLVQPAGPYDVQPELSVQSIALTGFFSTLALYDQPTAAMITRARQALEQVGMLALADHQYATLSSGERIRTLIARALVAQPKLLLLDEPTSGLDLLAREQVLATISHLHAQPQRPTIILITHHTEELPPTTHSVLLLDRGQLAGSGTPAQVLRDELLSRVYRCPLHVRNSNGRYYIEVQADSWRHLLPDNHAPIERGDD